MSRYSLDHLSDSTLLREVASLVSQDRQTTAKLLAHLAEVATAGDLSMQPSDFGDGDAVPVTCEVAARPVAGNPDTHSQHLAPAPTRAVVRPLAPERYGLQVTISAETRDLLRRAQDLLGHQVAPQDLPQVLHRALAALVEKLEKSKLAAVARPREKRRESGAPRHVPAAVKREVWKRDGHRCTFLADGGRRCEATRGLELDHVQELARGGRTTAANLRLRCRAHNQYTAERAFGVDFMAARRAAGRSAPVAKRAGPDPPE